MSTSAGRLGSAAAARASLRGTNLYRRKLRPYRPTAHGARPTDRGGRVAGRPRRIAVQSHLTLIIRLLVEAHSRATVFITIAFVEERGRAEDKA